MSSPRIRLEEFIVESEWPFALNLLVRSHVHDSVTQKEVTATWTSNHLNSNQPGWRLVPSMRSRGILRVDGTDARPLKT